MAGFAFAGDEQHIICSPAGVARVAGSGFEQDVSRTCVMLRTAALNGPFARFLSQREESKEWSEKAMPNQNDRKVVCFWNIFD